MTTPRAYNLVSRTAMMILTLALAACTSAPGRVAPEAPSPTEATQVRDTNPPEGALLAAGEKVTLLLYR